MASKAELLTLLEGSGQEHIVDDFDTLTDDEKNVLAHQITHCAHDFTHLNDVLTASLHALDHMAEDDEAAVRPPPKELIWDVHTTLGEEVTWHHSSDVWHRGLEIIAQGKAAVLMMAGGSGTRLGVTIPKGLFICDPLPQQKSLFEIDCAKILRTQALAAAAWPREGQSSTTEPHNAVRIPLLIMTSEENDAATRQFFIDHAYFGLDKDQVLFFKQSSLPCYDETTGKILMADRGRMCVAPGGNGGLYQALAHTHQPSGRTTLDELRHRRVEYVQIFSIDNILARIADPLFFGHAAREDAHVVVKTVAKVGPSERVGVFAQRADNDAWVVVEYTEIGQTRSEMRDPATGDLAFNCGNIASHCCSVAFLAYAAEKMRSSTQYHAARKTIATRTGPHPAVKLEAFIFDVFQFCNDAALQAVTHSVHNGEGKKEERLCSGTHAKQTQKDRFRIMQVNRQEEFAPIKNAETAATDTATTAARLLLQLHTKWVIDAVRALPVLTDHSESVSYRAALEALESGEVQVEISPLVSLQGEGLGPYLASIVEQVLATRARPPETKESDSARVVSVTRRAQAEGADEAALLTDCRAHM